MKSLYDKVSLAAGKCITQTYSTSFSLGIRCLHRRFRDPVYSIYGFVRLADEIVDSFHDYDKRMLLAQLSADTKSAIADGISINPVLNGFREVVDTYHLDGYLIDTFLQSMAMDLDCSNYSEKRYETYILGSAQVVGLMCLRVFTENDNVLFEQLKPAAMSLGAAFQKVNFLRDMKADHLDLGRVYFPGVNFSDFSAAQKRVIEADIEADFCAALDGIRKLPASSRFGVYTAYLYYRKLFTKIRNTPPSIILTDRVRIPDYQKLNLLAYSFIKNRLSII